MKMYLDFETCENLMKRLKANDKFKILEDDKPHAFWEGIDYWSYTILESANLKAIYAHYDLCDQNDITIIDKSKNKCVYSNSPYLWEFGADKLEKVDIGSLEDLVRYVDNNL
jgi:hypothetical protein